jgi:CubicO group peptidase (beta-lactamase class C family)
MLLGDLIEQVSGQPFETFVQEVVLEPLQLTHSSFDQAIGERAVGYFDKTSPHTAPHRIMPYAAGSLYSTTEDLNRWLQALSGDGALSPALADEMVKSQVQNPTDNGWDVGYGTMLGTAAGHRVISLSGDMDGYRSALDWYPDDRLVIIVLVNQETISPFATSELLAKKVLSLK